MESLRLIPSGEAKPEQSNSSAALQDISQLYGRKLSASDGDIGCVKDFYFDDKTWTVHYLVADTGSWLSGRQALLAPGTHSVGPFDAKADIWRVNLNRKEIENGPSMGSRRPDSRRYGDEQCPYYGWPADWQDVDQRGDMHLRSTKAMTGYAIKGPDGSIGCVCSFMVDGGCWAIRELVVETGRWYACRKILLLSVAIDRISYEDSTMFVKLGKKDVLGLRTV